MRCHVNLLKNKIIKELVVILSYIDLKNVDCSHFSIRWNYFDGGIRCLHVASDLQSITDCSLQSDLTLDMILLFLECNSFLLYEFWVKFRCEVWVKRMEDKWSSGTCKYVLMFFIIKIFYWVLSKKNHLLSVRKKKIILEILMIVPFFGHNILFLNRFRSFE